MFMKPTTMLFRNLMSMDVEESITANPIDGVVLLCGCDKPLRPANGGRVRRRPGDHGNGWPNASGRWHGQPLGSGTDGRKLFEDLRAGRIGEEEWAEVEGCISRSAGHCTVMGTASTMASMGRGTRHDAVRRRCDPGGRFETLPVRRVKRQAIVEMVKEDLKPSRILTREAFENAIRADMAIGGSTNAVVHLLAIAGAGWHSPVAGRLRPHLARDSSHRQPQTFRPVPHGGLLLRRGAAVRDEGTLATTAPQRAHGQRRTVAEHVENIEVRNRDLIRSLDAPLNPEGGTAVLYGNLAPNGAVIKQTAASPHLLRHRGKALVFERYEALQAHVDDEDLEVNENTVMVLKNAGPLGGPGFPEWGHLPIPAKLLRAGINDIVRVSDARMSGTSFGTDVLHVSPESAIGGPLAAVRTGDEIDLDVPARRIDLRLEDREIQRRLTEVPPQPPPYRRGYGKLFQEQVTQAHLGCDFEFLAHEAEEGSS